MNRNDVMTREEFKKRWESDDIGGGINFEDVANCYVAWGLGRTPRIMPRDVVLHQVLIAADTEDAEDYAPEEIVAEEPLYTHPPRREPLTGEELFDIYDEGDWPISIRDFRNIARAIERAHGIGTDE